MRIWHQSFTVLEDLPTYAAALRAHLDKIKRPDTEIVMHGQRPGTYPSDYPGDDLAFNYLYVLHGNQWVANALIAQREGFDAYAMCSMPNPMISEIRSLVDIPVTGYGEAAALIACLLGRKFCVMTLLPDTISLYTQRVRDYGLEARCAGVQHVGFEFHDVLSGYTDPGPLIERFKSAARTVINQTGADVLIGGSMPLAVLLATHGVTRVDNVPIVEGLAATIKMAEMMVDLRSTCGLTVSRHGRYNAGPRPERLMEVFRFYGLDKLLDGVEPWKG